MSKRLEDFIHDNRDGFDELEPKPASWISIEQRLSFDKKDTLKQKEAKTFSLAFVLRVAAIIVTVMGVSFVLYLQSGKNKVGGVDLAAINPIYAKQQMQYASLVKAKRSELKAIARIDPQLYEEFNGEITKMDAAYKKLTSDLKTTPNQERVLHAMIRNLQVQSEVLNQQLQVIEQYNQQIKSEGNENKNI